MCRWWAALGWCRVTRSLPAIGAVSAGSPSLPPRSGGAKPPSRCAAARRPSPAARAGEAHSGIRPRGEGAIAVVPGRRDRTGTDVAGRLAIKRRGRVGTGAPLDKGRILRPAVLLAIDLLAARHAVEFHHPLAPLHDSAAALGRKCPVGRVARRRWFAVRPRWGCFLRLRLLRLGGLRDRRGDRAGLLSLLRRWVCGLWRRRGRRRVLSFLRLWLGRGRRGTRPGIGRGRRRGRRHRDRRLFRDWRLL